MFFSCSYYSDSFDFVSAFKAAFALPLSPSLYPPSDSAFRLLGCKVLFSPSSTVLGWYCKGFMGFSAGCNSRFQSPSYVLRCSWLTSNAAVQAFGISNIFAMGSNDAIKGTSVETLDSSELSPGASVPYFGC